MPGNLVRWVVALALAIAMVVLLAAYGTASADEPDDEPQAAGGGVIAGGRAPSNSLCLACHSKEGTSKQGVFGIGRHLEPVAPGAFYTSAHRGVACAECHQNQTDLPHEKFSGAGEPLAPVTSSDVCRSCHGGAAEEFMDSVHGTVTRLGDERAPTCTDCHSVHAVQPIETWSATEKAAACAKCHDGADAAFAGSLTHVEPTVKRLPVDYIATRFFGALLVAVVGIGILHVELDMLRWVKGKLTRKSREGKQ